MKNLSLISVLIITAGSAVFGQGLQKGNLVGLHVATINLNPDVTMNQYKDFFIKTAAPEYEKSYPPDLKQLNNNLT